MQILALDGPRESPPERRWQAALAGFSAAVLAAGVVLPVAQVRVPDVPAAGLFAALYVGLAVTAAALAYWIVQRPASGRLRWPANGAWADVAAAAAWAAPAVLLAALGSVGGVACAAVLGVLAAKTAGRYWQGQSPAGPLWLSPAEQPIFGGPSGASDPAAARRARILLAVGGVYAAAVVVLAGHLASAVPMAAASGLAFAWPGARREARKGPARMRLAGRFLSVSLAVGLSLLGFEFGSALEYRPASEAASGAVAAPPGDYASVVLLAGPAELEPSAPQQPRLLAPSSGPGSTSTRIPFSGEYWFFYWPLSRPGTDAFRRPGDPMLFAYTSVDGSALTMEARQPLAKAIDVGCCRAIDVALQHREERPDSVWVELRLLGTAEQGRVSQSLGMQTLANAVVPPAGGTISLRFFLPADSAVRQIDELAVVFLLASSRSGRSSPVAVRYFELAP